MPRIGRRAFVGGLAALAARGAEALNEHEDRLAALEKRAGGRLGVAVIEAGRGLRLAHRADERFPMCSTFKLLASAAVLKRVDEGLESLDKAIPYGPADLQEYAPVTRAHVGAGAMRLGDLCAAAIDWSDNTAGNLILAVIGGPAGFTDYVRALGDEKTRLDRDEPSLNTAIPGDPRDTTTPEAMARDMEHVLLGDALSAKSWKTLEAWLMADKVGDQRLRAGLPPSWGVGDKTGSGGHGTANTIGILRPPGRPPLLAAVYYTETVAAMEARNSVHKEVGEIIAATF